MRIEIYRVPAKPGEWAQIGTLYSFRPTTGQDVPVAIIETPPEWILVGDPEPLLVRRTSHSDFTTRTATEVFYHGMGAAEGFEVVQLAEEDRERLAAALVVFDARPKPEARPELPAPSRNGKKNLPARRGQS